MLDLTYLIWYNNEMVFMHKIPRNLLQMSLILIVAVFVSANVSAKLVFVTEGNETNSDNFIINADDSSSDFVDLEFGSSLGVSLSYDILNDLFSLNRDLQINGNISITGEVIDSNGNGGTAGQILISDGLGANKWRDGANILIDTDGDTMIQVEEGADDDSIRFDTAGSERVIIDQNGNVGIGVADPTSKLEVNGDIVASGANASLELSVLQDSSDFPRAGFKILSDGNANNYGFSIRNDQNVPSATFLEIVNAEDYDQDVSRGFIYQDTTAYRFASTKDSGISAGTDMEFTTLGFQGDPAITIPSGSRDVEIGGDIGIGISPTAKIHALGSDSSIVVEKVQAASGQTANLTEWQNNNGDILARVAADGGIYTDSTATKYQFVEMHGCVRGSAAAGTVASGNSAVVRFDSGNNSQMRCSLPIPDDWQLGTDIILETFWSPSDNASGDIDFDLEYASFGVGDTIIPAAFVDTILATSYETVVTNTQLDLYQMNHDFAGANLGANEMLNFNLHRTPGDAGDTYGADINIHMIRLSYTGKKLR